jgi:crotonobetainyl-CoA:carnitine CoA-transferase CaiB-like acyl-CoA transferase
MEAPLGDIRVLELTNSLAGPYCGLILAALGADVIKLEPPVRGDDTRSWGPPFWNGESAPFLTMNAGKRSIAIDLKSAAGVRAAQRVAESVDVVVQNLRPGLVKRFGLNFEALAERNERLIYCDIGAFGKVGPLKAEPGYDPLMQAAGGIMSVTGEPGRVPVRAGASIVDQGTGMWAAIGVLAALRRRDAGAGPQLVDLSLYETAVSWLPYQLVGYLASGRVPERLGSGVGILAPYQAFETQDGSVMIAAGNDRLYAQLCDALGIPHDPRFEINAQRVAHRDEVASLVSARVAERSTEDVVSLLRDAGVPVAPIQDLAQVVADEQTDALGLLQALPHPNVPEQRLVSPPLSLDGERLRYRSAAPALGEHTEEVLRELGFSDEEIAAASRP